MILLLLSFIILLLLSFPVKVIESQSTCQSDLPDSHNGNSLIRLIRPDLRTRRYHIYTPDGYSSTGSPTSKVVLTFHGWGDNGKSYTTSNTFQTLADQYNYIIVAPTGLSGNGEYNSWNNDGSNTGYGPNGVEPTCDISQNSPNYCYRSCRPCENRCQWTHCQDDDVQFVRDLIIGGNGFENALSDQICFDPSQIFVSGTSNGGMFTWTLIQDSRTAGLFKAAAPIVGSPHCGYDFAGPEYVPVISLMGKSDSTVPPSNLPWPGNPADECTVTRDGEAYYYVTSNRIVSTWADAGGCSVIDGEFPDTIYSNAELECRSWCVNNKPYAVDCVFDGGHIEPTYAIKAAYFFFSIHS